MLLKKRGHHGQIRRLVHHVKERLSFTVFKFIMWVSEFWNMLDGLVLVMFAVR